MSEPLEGARLREVWCRRELERFDRHAGDSEEDQRRRRSCRATSIGLATISTMRQLGRRGTSIVQTAAGWLRNNPRK